MGNILNGMLIFLLPFFNPATLYLVTWTTDGWLNEPVVPGKPGLTERSLEMVTAIGHEE
jgi:hypothetical protein